jgi:hypothetical protein
VTSEGSFGGAGALKRSSAATTQRQGEAQGYAHSSIQLEHELPQARRGLQWRLLGLLNPAILDPQAGGRMPKKWAMVKLRQVTRAGA